MYVTTSKADFLHQVRADRQAWESLVNSIPDERKEEPGAAGHWSVKDLIAHIAVYERWTYEWLEPALEGDPPNWNYPDDDEHLSMDERNERFYNQHRERSLEDIQSEAAQVFARMLAAIEKVPEDALDQSIQEYAPPVGAYYHDGASVREAIGDNSSGHYRFHIADVKAWLER